MKRNLSKPRFILMLCVVIFLFLILVVQFIVLSVYRSKVIELQEKLDQQEKQIEQNEQNHNSVIIEKEKGFELIAYELIAYEI